jgi:hypothetical protein
MIDYDSRSTWGPGPSGSRQAKKCASLQLFIGVCYIFGFIKFSKHTDVAAEPPESLLGPHYPCFRVRARSRRSRPDQGDYWEGALQLLYNKLSLQND